MLPQSQMPNQFPELVPYLMRVRITTTQQLSYCVFELGFICIAVMEMPDEYPIFRSDHLPILGRWLTFRAALKAFGAQRTDNLCRTAGFRERTFRTSKRKSRQVQRSSSVTIPLETFVCLHRKYRRSHGVLGRTLL